MERHLSVLVAIVALLAFSGSTARAITYVAEGVLSLQTNSGLGDEIGFEGAHIRIEVDADLASEPAFPTVAIPIVVSPIVGKFPIGETRAYFSQRAGGAPDAQIKFSSLAIGVLQTINEVSDPDQLVVPGQGSTDLESAINGLYITLPTITATLIQPYSEFTTYGSNGPIGRVPDLSIIGVADLSAGTLQVLRHQPGDTPSLYSRYSLTNLSLISIPEPSSFIFVGIGLILLSILRRSTARVVRPIVAAIVLLTGTALPDIASAFDSNHCWNLSACPGSPGAITDESRTFFTYLDTDTHPIGHCANVWVVYYNDAIVRPISVTPVTNPFDPEFGARMLPAQAAAPNANKECLTCDTDLTVIWEDHFDNGFTLPVTNPAAEVKVEWEFIAAPPAQIILDGIDGAESVWNASHQCLTGFLHTDTFGTLITVPEPRIAAGLAPAILALLLLFSGSAARAQQETVNADLTEDGIVDNADSEEFILRYTEGDLTVDYNHDSELSPADLELFSAAWAAAHLEGEQG